jgi:hypothetical protein
MAVEADTTELESMTQLMRRRADHMVEDAGREALARASNYQASKVPQPGIKHARTLRKRVLSPTASGSLIARFYETAMYRRLEDFFGEW